MIRDPVKKLRPVLIDLLGQCLQEATALEVDDPDVLAPYGRLDNIQQLLLASIHLTRGCRALFDMDWHKDV